MTSRDRFLPETFYDSMILWTNMKIKGATDMLPPSCWPPVFGMESHLLSYGSVNHLLLTSPFYLLEWSFYQDRSHF